MIQNLSIVILSVLLVLSAIVSVVAWRRSWIFAAQISVSVLWTIFLVLNINSAFTYIILSAFIISDLVLLAFLGAVEVITVLERQNIIARRLYYFFITSVSFVSALAIIYYIFSASFNLPTEAAATAKTFYAFFQQLWHGNFLYVFMLGVFICINMLGSLLMIRRRS